MDTASLMKEIALSHPQVARTLDQLQINYCCNSGGKLSLAEACQNAGLEADAVLAQLQEAQATVPASPPDTAAPSALIRHLLDIHHAFTRSELARLDGLLARLQERHWETQPELQELAACYQSLRDDLLPHLKKRKPSFFPISRRWNVIASKALPNQ